MRHIAFIILLTAFLPTSIFADTFDYYFNPVLNKVPKSKNAKKIEKLTPDVMVDHSRVLPGVTATFVVVKTNEGRMSKMLVLPARQKIGDDKSVPILLIDRYATFRNGEERTTVAKGQNVRLFEGFHFNLDLGQVVPSSVGGDLQIVVKDDDFIAKPVGKAEMYLVTKHFPEAKPEGSEKIQIGDKFEPRYFNGVYKLYDDGRRTATLHLNVNKKGLVSGHYFSGKDGSKYPVSGKISDPNYSIHFRVMFPQTIQYFNGWMFTANGKAIAGWAVMQKRESGFYAVRVEKGK